MESVIADRLRGIRAQIARITDPALVRIIGVTKTYDASVVAAAYAAGITDIGENYAQEAAQKFAEVTPLVGSDRELTWHFIGHLQRNKVKMLVPFVNVWQSVDSSRLASEIASRAPNATVFVEVNLTGQDGRSGCNFVEASALVEHCRNLGLTVRGLMGIGPQGTQEEVRPYFQRLKKLNSDLELQELSMGMSNDYEVAIQEGATTIRLVAPYFGSRASGPRS